MPFKKSAVKRTKSTDILPANEYNRKRADVVEELKNKRINITYKNGNRNWVSEDNYSTDTMNIFIASPAVKGIPQRTALWHELSHVLHNSFASGFFKMAEQLSKKQVNRILDKYPVLGTAEEALANHTNRSMSGSTGFGWMGDYYEGQLMQLYRMSFNAIEDQRIESLTGGVWLGTGKMFNKMRDALGDRLLGNLKNNVNQNGIDNPINHLLLIRFNQSSAVKADHKLHKAMADVSGKDEFGSIVIWKRYVKPVIDKWFMNNVEKELKEHEESISNKVEETNQTESKVEEYEDKKREVDELKSYSYGDVEKKMQQYDEMLSNIGSEETKAIQDKESWADKTERVYRNLSQTRYKKEDELAKMRTDINGKADALEDELRDMARAASYDGSNTEVSQETGMHTNQCKITEGEEDDSLVTRCEAEGIDLDSEDISEDDMDTMLVESEEGGASQVKEIKNGLSGMAMPKEPSNIQMVVRYEEDNNVDTTLVTGLRNIVSKLKERNVPTLSDTGDEFDEDEYINLKQRGYGDVFKQSKLSNGIDILVSIDGSGSMESNDNIGEARKLVSSLFKVAQTIPELSVEANVWSSNTSGDVGMTTIKTLADCKNISTHVTSSGRYYETPTHEALSYSARRLKGMQGRHKMLILITDGYPQFSKGGTHMSNKSIVTACKKSLRKVMQVTDNVICINVEPRGYSTVEMLKDIFGKRYVEYAGVKKANEFVSKTLKRKFIEVLRR